MTLRLRRVAEALRASYWFLPSLMVAAAVGLAVGMVRVDETIRFALLEDARWVYTGGAEGARGVLSTVASAVLGTAGVTFSITIAALSLASSQFGPRLLRNFMRDRGNQWVLGSFVATFAYCLLVLRTVRGTDYNEFVPHLAVSLGVLLGVLSLGVLIFFIHHIAVSIQAPHVIAEVAAELDRGIERLFPESVGEPLAEEDRPPPAPALPPDGEAACLTAPRDGYVQAVDADAVLDATQRHDLVLRLEVRPGDWVVRGAPVLRAWPRGRGVEAVSGGLRNAVALGTERSDTQDVGYPLDQLVEVAVRALSPGVNDPFTAMQCLDRLGAALCRLADRSFPHPVRVDEGGTPRVIAARPLTFGELLDAAFDPIRRHARGDAAVTFHILDTLALVMARTRAPDDQAAARAQAERAWRGARDSLPDPDDQRAAELRLQAVYDATPLA